MPPPAEQPAPAAETRRFLFFCACGRKFRSSLKQVGRLHRCGRCGMVLTIPNPYLVVRETDLPGWVKLLAEYLLRGFFLLLFLAAFAAALLVFAAALETLRRALYDLPAWLAAFLASAPAYWLGAGIMREVLRGNRVIFARALPWFLLLGGAAAGLLGLERTRQLLLLEDARAVLLEVALPPVLWLLLAGAALVVLGRDEESAWHLRRRAGDLLGRASVFALEVVSFPFRPLISFLLEREIILRLEKEAAFRSREFTEFVARERHFAQERLRRRKLEVYESIQQEQSAPRGERLVADAARDLELANLRLRQELLLELLDRYLQHVKRLEENQSLPPAEKRELGREMAGIYRRLLKKI